MAEGVDYAWGRPGVTALKNAGKTFAARYLSHDTSGKSLDHREAVQLSNGGIWLVVVWETTAQRSLAGYAAGAQDARDAIAQSKACGMPQDRPIFFAVDFDASPGQRGTILNYFKGVNSVLGAGRTGMYGGYYPIKWAFDAKVIAWGWQTYAWSGGRWDTRIHLKQYSNDHVIGGVGLDYDRSTKSDYGQWKVGVSPNVTPTPPAPPSNTEEDDMPSGILNREAAPNGVKETAISFAPGKWKKVGFLGDNGLLGHAVVELRVAMHTTAGDWPGKLIQIIKVDSTKTKTVLDLPADCDGLSISYKDDGVVPVGWDIS